MTSLTAYFRSSFGGTRHDVAPSFCAVNIEDTEDIENMENIDIRIQIVNLLMFRDVSILTSTQTPFDP